MVKTRRVRAKDGEASEVAAARALAAMKAAEHAGLLDGKSTQISVRISLALVEQAKKRSGIQSDTQLIEFALASLALEDDFGHALLTQCMRPVASIANILTFNRASRLPIPFDGDAGHPVRTP